MASARTPVLPAPQGAKTRLSHGNAGGSALALVGIAFAVGIVAFIAYLIWKSALTATLVLVAIAIVVLTDYWNKRRARRHLAGREGVSEQAFGQRFYPTDVAPIAGKIREILARHIPVDISRLHPSDRPVEDLRMDALDSLATVQFVVDLEEEFDLKIGDHEAERLTTFDDVVQFVAEKLRERARR